MNADPTIVRQPIAAPVSAVWSLCTTPEGLARWFGPDGGHLHVEVLELRPGGAFRGLVVGPAQTGGGRGRGASKPRTWPHEAVVVAAEPDRVFSFDVQMPVGPGTAATARIALRFTGEEDATLVDVSITAERPDMQVRAAFGWDRALARLTLAARPDPEERGAPRRTRGA